MNLIIEVSAFLSLLGKSRISNTAISHKGQGLVEYALIISFVAIVVIIILILLGPSIGNMFSNIVSNI